MENEIKPMSRKRITRMYQIAPDLVIKASRSLYSWEYHTNNKELSKQLAPLIRQSLDRGTMIYKWVEKGKWTTHIIILKHPRPTRPARLYKSEVMRAVAIARSLRPAPANTL